MDLVAFKNKSFIVKNEFVDNDKWNNLINSTNFKTPFQTQKFFEVCNKVQGHEGLVLAVEGEDSSYLALCVTDIICERGVKSIFSKRAIIYGGPLISNEGGSDALQTLLESLVKELHKKVIYIEIRNYNNYKEYKTLYNHLQWDYIPWLNARKHLDFSDLNELIKSFKYNRRREIRLSFNAGLSYHETFNLNEIEGFYEILKTTYRKKIGLPLPNLQFFIEFVDSGLMKVFVVKDKNDIIGGSFCVFYNEDSIFTFYYCGIRNYTPKAYPTHLAVLAAMEFGINNRLKYIDFMGAGKPGEEYGVRKYKMGFNPELSDDGRFLKIENKLLYNIGYQAIKVLKWIRLNSLFLS